MLCMLYFERIKDIECNFKEQKEVFLMPTVRFALNDEYYNRLENDAQNAHMFVQDYIRFKLFNETTIFSVDEAVRRIKQGSFENTEFTLPDVYGEAWTMTKEEGAGAFGKYFFTYITEHPELGIKFVPERTIKRRAVYTYNKVD